MIVRLLILSCLCFPLLAQQASTGFETLDNQAIVSMVKAGLAEEVVLAKIRSTPGRYDVSAQALVNLKENGVSDRVIMLMMAENNSQPRVTQPAAPKPALQPQPAPQTQPARTPQPSTRRQPAYDNPPYTPRPATPTYTPSPADYDDEPGTERGVVFGGLAYSRGDLEENFLGWGAALTTRLTDKVGLKSDFSGVYTNAQSGLDFSLYSFAVGPEFRTRWERTNLFAHTLVGLSRTASDLNFRNAGANNLEFVFGGGFDFWLTRSFGVRVLQADYQLIRAGGESVHMGRASAGAVFRF